METGGCTRFSEIYCIISVFNCHYGKQDKGCLGFGDRVPLISYIKEKADMAFVGSICFKVS